MARAILHIDMDAFYASVEQRDDPRLRGKPVIVGGHPKRGVVLAASYEVRPLGVRSAMPMSQALHLAPRAIVVPPRFGAYVEASEQVFRILETATPIVEPLSLDEAFLDVTASVRLLGPPSQIASSLRERIARQTGLKASAGIAPVKLVAKLASDLAKPNGQLEVPEGTVQAFLAPLPVSRLWGVGPKLEETLVRNGLRTIGDIAGASLPDLHRKVGSIAEHLFTLSRGIDDREVIADRQAKSIGSEDTFEEDLSGIAALQPHIHSQSLRVGARLRRAHLKARVVQLKLKLHDFQLITRRATLPSATDDGQELYRTALLLLERVEPHRPVRLTGVSAQGLVGEAGQMTLFSTPPSKSRRLNAALDQIGKRFGPGTISTADVFCKEERDDELRVSIGASRLDARAAKKRRG